MSNTDGHPGRYRRRRPIFPLDRPYDPVRTAHPPRVVEGRRVEAEVSTLR